MLQGYFPCHNAVEVVQNTRYEAELDLADPTGSVFCAHGAGFVVPWYEVKHYMHIQTGLPVLGQEACAAPEPDRSGWNAHSGGGSTSAPFGADDKELEAIFTRTYGESKRKLSYDSGPRQVVYDAGTYNRTKRKNRWKNIFWWMVITFSMPGMNCGS